MTKRRQQGTRVSPANAPDMLARTIDFDPPSAMFKGTSYQYDPDWTLRNLANRKLITPAGGSGGASGGVSGIGLSADPRGIFSGFPTELYLLMDGKDFFFYEDSTPGPDGGLTKDRNPGMMEQSYGDPDTADRYVAFGFAQAKRVANNKSTGDGLVHSLAGILLAAAYFNQPKLADHIGTILGANSVDRFSELTGYDDDSDFAKALRETYTYRNAGELIRAIREFLLPTIKAKGPSQSTVPLDYTLVEKIKEAQRAAGVAEIGSSVVTITKADAETAAQRLRQKFFAPQTIEKMIDYIRKRATSAIAGMASEKEYFMRQPEAVARKSMERVVSEGRTVKGTRGNDTVVNVPPLSAIGFRDTGNADYKRRFMEWVPRMTAAGLYAIIFKGDSDAFVDAFEELRKGDYAAAVQYVRTIYLPNPFWTVQLGGMNSPADTTAENLGYAVTSPDAASLLLPKYRDWDDLKRNESVPKSLSTIEKQKWVRQRIEIPTQLVNPDGASPPVLAMIEKSWRDHSAPLSRVFYSDLDRHLVGLTINGYRLDLLLDVQPPDTQLLVTDDIDFLVKVLPEKYRGIAYNQPEKAIEAQLWFIKHYAYPQKLAYPTTDPSSLALVKLMLMGWSNNNLPLSSEPIEIKYHSKYNYSTNQYSYAPAYAGKLITDTEIYVDPYDTPDEVMALVKPYPTSARDWDDMAADPMDNPFADLKSVQEYALNRFGGKKVGGLPRWASVIQQVSQKTGVLEITKLSPNQFEAAAIALGLAPLPKRTPFESLDEAKAYVVKQGFDTRYNVTPETIVDYARGWSNLLMPSEFNILDWARAHPSDYTFADKSKPFKNGEELAKYVAALVGPEAYNDNGDPWGELITQSAAKRLGKSIEAAVKHGDVTPAVVDEAAKRVGLVIGHGRQTNIGDRLIYVDQRFISDTEFDEYLQVRGYPEAYLETQGYLRYEIAKWKGVENAYPPEVTPFDVEQFVVDVPPAEHRAKVYDKPFVDWNRAEAYASIFVGDGEAPGSAGSRNYVLAQYAAEQRNLSQGELTRRMLDEVIAASGWATQKLSSHVKMQFFIPAYAKNYIVKALGYSAGKSIPMRDAAEAYCLVFADKTKVEQLTPEEVDKGVEEFSNSPQYASLSATIPFGTKTALATYLTSKGISKLYGVTSDLLAFEIGVRVTPDGNVNKVSPALVDEYRVKFPPPTRDEDFPIGAGKMGKEKADPYNVLRAIVGYNTIGDYSFSQLLDKLVEGYSDARMVPYSVFVESANRFMAQPDYERLLLPDFNDEIMSDYRADSYIEYKLRKLGADIPTIKKVVPRVLSDAAKAVYNWRAKSFKFLDPIIETALAAFKAAQTAAPVGKSYKVPSDTFITAQNASDYIKSKIGPGKFMDVTKLVTAATGKNYSGDFTQEEVDEAIAKFQAGKQTIKVGDRVVRGPDWNPIYKEDGGAGKLGTVTDIILGGKWVTVRWDAGLVDNYRWGAEGKYDLQVVVGQPQYAPIVDGDQPIGSIDAINKFIDDTVAAQGGTKLKVKERLAVRAIAVQKTGKPVTKLSKNDIVAALAEYLGKSVSQSSAAGDWSSLPPPPAEVISPVSTPQIDDLKELFQTALTPAVPPVGEKSLLDKPFGSFSPAAKYIKSVLADYQLPYTVGNVGLIRSKIEEQTGKFALDSATRADVNMAVEALIQEGGLAGIDSQAVWPQWA